MSVMVEVMKCVDLIQELPLILPNHPDLRAKPRLNRSRSPFFIKAINSDSGICLSSSSHQITLGDFFFRGGRDFADIDFSSEYPDETSRISPCPSMTTYGVCFCRYNSSAVLATGPKTECARRDTLVQPDDNVFKR